jgi:predicted secreted acid phosphatase
MVLTRNVGKFDMPTRPTLKPLILIALLLVGCQTTAQAPPPIVSSEPANVGDAKIAATNYHNSGAYERDLATVASAAEAWISQRAPTASRPAIVFDIDETAMSNWDVIRADDFGRVIPGPCAKPPAGPCGWEAWDMRGQSTAIKATLALYRHARSLNVAVFFITGRPENQRKPTVRNLRAVGYATFEQLIMPPNGAHFASAADFKAPKRATIEQAGYTIIANVGDQPSDLAGGHAEKTFLLPDPFYRIP